MNIVTLIQELSNYPSTTEIKIVVNDIEENIRCMIHDKNKGIIYLADSSYGC